MENPKKQLRPEILSIIKTENFSALEKFQNETLRPIIKLQHDLILTRFEHYLKQNKINIIELNKTQKTDLMNKLFKSDTRLKNDFRGLIIGLFTLEEYKEYLTISSQLNKRINNMIRQKLDNS
jgi:hypothetical protein|tara:strand:- start:1331 stop:1699 length:369 start_codon:yes stop_codon:yes gene_type:complete